MSYESLFSLQELLNSLFDSHPKNTKHELKWGACSMQNVQGVQLLKIKTEDLNLRSNLREFSSKIGSDRIDIGLNRIGSKISDRIGFNQNRIGSDRPIENPNLK